MVNEWRPDESFEERLQRMHDNLTPNLLGGFSPNPTLMPGGGDNGNQAASVRGVTSGFTGIKHMVEKLKEEGEAPASQYTTTYVPLNNWPHVWVGGCPQNPVDDFTMTGKTLTILAGMDLATDEELMVRYDYAVGTVPSNAEYPPYVQAVLDSGPEAYWRFQETGGATAFDFTDNNHDALVIGTPVWGNTPSLVASLVAEGATYVSFDGAGDRVEAPDSAGFDGSEFSIEFWIVGSGGAGQGFYIRIGASVPKVDVWGTSEGNGAFDIYTAAGVNHRLSGMPFMAGGAHLHMVLTHSAADDIWEIYQNGSLALSGTTFGALRNPTGAYQIGALGGNTAGLHVEQEHAYYTKRLTAAEIALHYAAGIAA